MKKIIAISICLFFIKATVKAQVSDTAVYIQQILLNKSKYVDKPFSVLEKDLKIKIKDFSPHADMPIDISKETSTSIWFIKPEAMEDFSFPRLLIYWQPYLDYNKAWSLFQKYNGGDWTPEVDSFYSVGIIKDISVLGQLVDNNGNLLLPPK